MLCKQFFSQENFAFKKIKRKQTEEYQWTQLENNTNELLNTAKKKQQLEMQERMKKKIIEREKTGIARTLS